MSTKEEVTYEVTLGLDLEDDEPVPSEDVVHDVLREGLELQMEDWHTACLRTVTVQRR